YAKDGVGPYAITVSFGGPGSGASVDAQATVNGAGQVVVYGLTNLVGGAGYSSIPSMTFVPNAHLGTITPAAAHVTGVGDGRVTSVTVTNGGSYSGAAPSVTFSAPGGGGVTATGHAIVGGSAVTSIILTSPGSGYLPTDTVTVTIAAPGGGGTTATA